MGSYSCPGVPDHGMLAFTSTYTIKQSAWKFFAFVVTSTHLVGLTLRYVPQLITCLSLINQLCQQVGQNGQIHRLYQMPIKARFLRPLPVFILAISR